MEDEKKTYIEDIDFLLEEMQNPDYFCRIFTCSDNGRPQTLIKSKVTPVSEEDLEDLLYNKGIEEADNFFIILYADTKGKEKLFGGRLWLNPRPKNMNKKKQNNLSGDYNQQQYNPMTFYESGVNNTMKLVKEMQEGYNQSLDKIVAVMKEQETERKQLAEELKKTYQKQVKEDKASENGAGIMNLLGSFAPVIAQGLANSQNQQQNQNFAGFQQRPPNIPANAIPLSVNAINKIIDDRNKDNNNNEN